MKIKSAKYFKTDTYEGEKNVSVFVTLEDDTLLSVPLNATGNRHWDALQEWVKAGNNITAAD